MNPEDIDLDEGFEEMAEEAEAMKRSIRELQETSLTKDAIKDLDLGREANINIDLCDIEVVELVVMCDVWRTVSHQIDADSKITDLFTERLQREVMIQAEEITRDMSESAMENMIERDDGDGSVGFQ